MLDCGELNISEITRRSGLSHASTVHHLEFLRRSGIVTEKRFNRIRIYRLERANPLVTTLSRFFTEWREIDRSSMWRDAASSGRFLTTLSQETRHSSLRETGS